MNSSPNLTQKARRSFEQKVGQMIFESLRFELHCFQYSDYFAIPDQCQYLRHSALRQWSLGLHLLLYPSQQHSYVTPTGSMPLLLSPNNYEASQFKSLFSVSFPPSYATDGDTGALWLTTIQYTDFI